MDVVRLERLDIRIGEDNDPAEIGYFVPDCVHAFCSPCLAQYLEMKLKEPVITFPVKCPHYECENSITDTLVERVLDFESMTLWWDKQAEAGMNNKIYCPHPDCAVPLENDVVGASCDSMAECPVCNRAFCSACISKWHPGKLTWSHRPRQVLGTCID